MPLYKLGKKEAQHDDRTLCLVDYTKHLDPAPTAFSLTAKVSHLGMMLNDQLGCCTIASAAHIIQQDTAENEHQVIIPDSTIAKVYSDVSGYVPGQPNTDNGAILMDVLKYWNKTGIGGHTIPAYASVKPTSDAQVRNTVFYFGNAYVGLALPESAQDQDVWSVVSHKLSGSSKPNSWGGHAIPIVSYDKDTLTCITWGSFKKMTWDFFRTYCDEAYAVLSPDWFAADGKCPVGFNLQALQKDLTCL